MKTRWIGLEKDVGGIPDVIGRIVPAHVFKGLNGVYLFRGSAVKALLKDLIGFSWPQGLPSVYFHGLNIICVDLATIDEQCRLAGAPKTKKVGYYLIWITHEFAFRRQLLDGLVPAKRYRTVKNWTAIESAVWEETFERLREVLKIVNPKEWLDFFSELHRSHPIPDKTIRLRKL